jgi:hypothetical protein
MNKFTEEDILAAYEFGENGDRDYLYALITKNKWPTDMSEESKQTRKEIKKSITDIADKAWEDANNEGNENDKAFWIHGFVSGYTY